MHGHSTHGDKKWQDDDPQLVQRTLGGYWQMGFALFFKRSSEDGLPNSVKEVNRTQQDAHVGQGGPIYVM